MISENRLELLRNIYQEQMPFNRLLKISISDLTTQNTCVRVDMRKELVGNFVKKILHGGVISSVLDLTGGLIASVEILKQMENENVSTNEIGRMLARVGTIDLRVDFLRGGRGNFFCATGSILRKGNKVAVVRTELTNDEKLLIAAGTGTYIVG